MTFRHSYRNNQALQAKLMQQGVICAYRGGGIRFSPHFYIDEPQLDQAIHLIKQEITSD